MKYYKAEDVIRKRAEDLADTSYWEYGNAKNVDEWLEVAEMEFKGLPTIDIVHCADCKYCEVYNLKHIYAECHQWGIKFEPFQDDTRTHYCAWGERIEKCHRQKKK